MSVPAVALYGVQTQRALDNFRVSNLRIHPALITAYAEIKQAAAEANRATGALKPELANAIARAAEELSAGHRPRCGDYPLRRGGEIGIERDDALCRICVARIVGNADQCDAEL